jgi:hypothetical protein
MLISWAKQSRRGSTTGISHLASTYCISAGNEYPWPCYNMEMSTRYIKLILNYNSWDRILICARILTWEAILEMQEPRTILLYPNSEATWKWLTISNWTHNFQANYKLQTKIISQNPEANLLQGQHTQRKQHRSSVTTFISSINLSFPSLQSDE